MRFVRLGLIAYGPFTDKILEFGSAGTGMQIIYGPNEAGKSTALRALEGFLYGIPRHTGDNYLHQNRDLRISATLQDTSGETLSLIRRKGNKDTLLDEQGNVASEAILNSWLSGLTPQMFSSLFALDHKSLVQGGEEILQQHGDLGQALFSASSARIGLKKFLDRLDEEAETLFKPRGVNQSINSHIAEYQELKSQSKSLALSAGEWEKKRASFDQTSAKLLTTQNQLQQARRELSKYQRYQRLLPRFAQRANIKRQLSLDSDAIELAEDFPERRRKIATDILLQGNQVRFAESEATSIAEKLASLNLNQALLDCGLQIQHIQTELGSYHSATKKIPRLRQSKSELQTKLNILLDNIRPGLSVENIESLRPLLSRDTTINELISKHEQLKAEIHQTEKIRRDKKQRAEKLRDRLRNRGCEESSHLLKAAIKRVHQAGELDAMIDEQTSRMDEEKQWIEQQIRRLNLWNGSIEECLELSLPGRESLQRFRDSRAKLDSEYDKLVDGRKDLRIEIARIRQEIARVKSSGKFPEIEDLRQIREEREQAWLLIKKILNGQEPQQGGSSDQAIDSEDLGRQFESCMYQSDEISDQLIQHADKVSQLSQLTVAQSFSEQKLKETESDIRNLDREIDTWKEQWSTFWRYMNITPMMPEEMTAWCGQVEKIQASANRWQSTTAEVEKLSRLRKSLIQSLLDNIGTEHIDAATDEISPLLTRAEMKLEELERTLRDHRDLQQQLQLLSDEIDSLDSDHSAGVQAMEDWRQQWNEALSGSGMRIDTAPLSAAVKLQEIREAFSILDHIQNTGAEIRILEADVDKVHQQYESLRRQFPAAERVDSLEGYVNNLHGQLLEQQSVKSLISEHTRSLEQSKKSAESAQRKLKILQAQMGELLLEANCDDVDQLEAIELRSVQIRNLKQSLFDIEAAILDDGEGEDLKTLEMELQSIDKAEIAEKIFYLDDKIHGDLEPAQKSLHEQKGREQKELELMDGSDQAADLIGQAEVKLAAIRSYSNEYIRLKIAAKILRDEIERFRQKNQGPLLSRAGDFFSTLTLNSFVSLKTDFSEKDEPVLVAIRESGDKVYVEGMSNGSRDQLYLALRLAAFEKYIDEYRAMPFVLDDVLIEFDDDRALSALRLFSTIAEKTQVILFTHHHRLLELSEKLDQPVISHRL